MVRSQDVDFAIAAAESALGLLPQMERKDAEELLQLCRSVWTETGAPSDAEVLRSAGRLIEVLARRSAQAMPYAALGRALVADLKGSMSDRNALLVEFQTKLSLLGM